MLYMCVMDIMNVLRTGMNISISRIHVRLCHKILPMRDRLGKYINTLSHRIAIIAFSKVKFHQKY